MSIYDRIRSSCVKTVEGAVYSAVKMEACRPEDSYWMDL